MEMQSLMRFRVPPQQHRMFEQTCKDINLAIAMLRHGAHNFLREAVLASRIVDESFQIFKLPKMNRKVVKVE
jgi:hypothetical protein